jgi:hypothetical protein
VKIFRDFKQYEPEWWAVRRGVPTASELHRIITPLGVLSKSETSHGYLCQLLGDRLRSDYGGNEDENNYVSAAMKNGTLMEPEAIDYYEARRDAKIDRVAFCLDDAGQYGCSPDALVGDDGGLESKSPTAKVQVERLLCGELPPEHRQQVHGSLVITGRKWWDFMSYHRDLPTLLVRVYPDKYTDLIRKAMAEFWTRYQEAVQRLAAMLPAMPTAPVVSDEEAMLACFTGR